jgi:tRNA(fMet)-specific endonuclease VapC
MLRYMLDTSVCIDALRRRPLFRARFRELGAQLSISAITLGELLHGAYRSARVAENLASVERFCARLDVLPFAERAAAQFGQIHAELARDGRVIGAYDLLIGSHARSEALILVTENRREFDRIPGLLVESWT